MFVYVMYFSAVRLFLEGFRYWHGKFLERILLRVQNLSSTKAIALWLFVYSFFLCQPLEGMVNFFFGGREGRGCIRTSSAITGFRKSSNRTCFSCFRPPGNFVSINSTVSVGSTWLVSTLFRWFDPLQSLMDKTTKLGGGELSRL